jgi:hypothetical protein
VGLRQLGDPGEDSTGLRQKTQERAVA